MKNEQDKQKALLEKWSDLYKAALNNQSERMASMELAMDQYLGSDVIDGSTEKAKTVRNITYEIIESQISADIPLPKIDPESLSERHEKNAKTIERLCSSLRNKLPLEEANDLDERYTYVYGGSVFYVEWDSNIFEREPKGGVKVHCISPTRFLPQPGISNIDDMEYCFLRFTTTRGEIMRKYGVSQDKLSLLECEYEFEGADSSSDTVSLITVFYRDEKGQIGRADFSGGLLLSDIPNYYKRKILICRDCGKETGICTCGGEAKPENLEFERVELNGEVITLPYYTPSHFPIVIRKNTLGDSPSHLGGSDCLRIRPQQQAINKIETRILEKLLRAGVTPVMPEGTSVTFSNRIFGQVIKTRPGETPESFGKIDTTPDISQDIEEADRLYDMAKRVLGISDALQGTDATKAESGFARQLKISQASSRLESKRRMKYLAYSEIYRLIFELYLAFADEKRELSYKDGLGIIHVESFDKRDFIEKDDGGYFYCDKYLFSVDLNSGSEYTREALWERNLLNLQSGTLGDSANPLTLLRFWQAQEKAHYPYARENVEYFNTLAEQIKKENEREKNNDRNNS